MEWISVKDRLPDIDLKCLYTDGEEKNIYLGSLVSGMGKDVYWSHYDFLEDTGITHWMPLPYPPKER